MPASSLEQILNGADYTTSILYQVIDHQSLGWLLFFLTLMVYLISKDQWLRLRKELQQYAMFDLLTGLPNRRFFEASINKAIQLSQRRSDRFTLILGDLDHFKDVNDTQGHHAGDEVLRQAAQRLKAAIRGGDTLARLGGDEFAFIIHSCNGELGHVEVCQRLKESLVEPVMLDGKAFRIGISLGCVTFPNDGLTMAELLRRADISLYKAKETRNNFVLYQPSFEEATAKDKDADLSAA